MRNTIFIKVMTLIGALMLSFNCVAFAIDDDDTAPEIEDQSSFATAFDELAAKGSITNDDISEALIESCIEHTSDEWSKASQTKLKSIIKREGEKREADTGKGEIGIKVDGVSYALTTDAMAKVKAHVAGVAGDSKVKSAVTDIGTSFNVEADISNAAQALSGIEGIVSTVVGVLVYAVTIGMTLFTACDICYITMPVFRNKCEDMKQSGGVGTKTDSSGNSVLMFVTDDAQHAVQVCTVETGKNPLALYAKKRVAAFILLGLVIFILLTGNIGLIVNIAVNIASGIIDVLSGLGG